MTLTVNRYLADPAMDDVDHALGRPLDPMRESYRNRYAVDAGDAAGRGIRCRRAPPMTDDSIARIARERAAVEGEGKR